MHTPNSRRNHFTPILLTALLAVPLMAAVSPPADADDLARLRADLVALVAWKGVATKIQRSDAPERCSTLFKSSSSGTVARLDYVLASSGGETPESACVFMTAGDGGPSWQFAPRRLLDGGSN